jgi:hypothetical protein
MKSLTLALALTALCAGTAASQNKPDPTRNARQGFWIGFGLGAGSAGVDCAGCDTKRVNGFSGHLRLGGTLSRHLLLGGETNGWVHSESGADESMGFGNLVLLWYPSATGAFYLKFGLGGMNYTATGTILGKLTATAASGSLGLGYEFRTSRNMSLNLFLNSLASAPATFKINGTTAPSSEDIKLNMVQLGLGLTWH